ncbi:hypothetical protein COOONC_21890 [Cooperia oncophora]
MVCDGNPSMNSIGDSTKAKFGETMVFSIMLPSFTAPPQEIKRKKSRLEIFVDFLQTKTAKTLVMLIFFVHVGVSTYLATEVSTDFNMENLYLEGSPLTDIHGKCRRNLLATYPSFHVMSHHPFEKVPTESAASAPKNFLQTAVSAIILMSILVLLFVMNWEAIISVVVSIVSICLGIVAYLHLWGVCLDAVSLISILMSVGFSVDYSAHVCYHYFAHAAEEERNQKDESDSIESGSSGSNQSINKPLKKSSKEESVKRLLATFHGVGWPVVQSGLSTIIGMLPLMFVRAYVVAVFWKTVLLVGILGMFHALLLLPVIFLLTEDIKRFFKNR